jgi:hypothetical protein
MGGGGPEPEPLTPLERPAPNHNRFVGYFSGSGTLPDGREVQVELVAEPNAYASGRVVVSSVAFTYLETRYNVAEAYAGSFAAEGALSLTSDPRRFYFGMRDIQRHAVDHRVFIGEGISFPNEDAQLSYYEDGPDGTFRQWAAVSGRLVFDAVNGTLASREGYKTNGKVTFHFENVRMAPSNSSSDPRFTGAQGSFTLDFSGTSTMGLKRYSQG